MRVRVCVCVKEGKGSRRSGRQQMGDLATFKSLTRVHQYRGVHSRQQVHLTHFWHPSCLTHMGSRQLWVRSESTTTGEIRPPRPEKPNIREANKRTRRACMAKGTRQGEDSEQTGEKGKQEQASHARREGGEKESKHLMQDERGKLFFFLLEGGKAQGKRQSETRTEKDR